jgi:hypothetical protein
MSEEELRREKLENEFTGAPAKTRPGAGFRGSPSREGSLVRLLAGLLTLASSD